MPYRSGTITAEGELLSEADLREAFDRGELASMRAWLGLDGGQPQTELEWEITPPVAPAAPAVADPAIGAQLPASGPGFYARSAPDRRFGRPETISALQAIGSAWARAHPDGPRIGIGDISRRGGGPFPPHASHRNGLDVDIRPVRGDRREEAVRYQLPAYSRALTQELVNLIRANGVLVVQHIFFNDPQVTGVRRWPGHDDHLHVRFTQTRAQPGPAQAPAAPGAPAAPWAPAAPGLPTTRLGTLVVRDRQGVRFRYQFTPEDLLWTARFIIGEAGGKDTPENRAVIWAMFNRYALFTHGLYPTFHQFIRAYSTPLQPVLKSWGAAKRNMTRRDWVSTGGTYVGRGAPPGIPKGQRRIYLELQRRPWSQLRPPAARALAEAALKGQIPNPIGTASQFGSTFVYYMDSHKGRKPTPDQWRRYTQDYARQKGWVWIGPVAGLDQKGNAFFIDRRSTNLPRDAVRVEP